MFTQAASVQDIFTSIGYNGEEPIQIFEPANISHISGYGFQFAEIVSQVLDIEQDKEVVFNYFSRINTLFPNIKDEIAIRKLIQKTNLYNKQLKPGDFLFVMAATIMLRIIFATYRLPAVIEGCKGTIGMSFCIIMSDSISDSTPDCLTKSISWLNNLSRKRGLTTAVIRAKETLAIVRIPILEAAVL